MDDGPLLAGNPAAPADSQPTRDAHKAPAGSFLARLLDAKIDGRALLEDEVTSNAYMYMFAGHNTAGNQVAFALYLLHLVGWVGWQAAAAAPRLEKEVGRGLNHRSTIVCTTHHEQRYTACMHGNTIYTQGSVTW